MNNCIFCDIIMGKAPCTKLYEDDTYIAILDIHPFSEVHTLIIPKLHHASISDIDDIVLAQMFVVAKKVSKQLTLKNNKIEGFNYVLSDGEVAGQDVFHAHLHVIPRFKKDGLRIIAR